MRRFVIISTIFALVAGFGGIWGPSASAGPGHDVPKWAFLVGVSKYQGKTKPTPGSANDALELRQVLIDHGWPADHIHVLTDGQATAGAIRNGFQWLADRSSDNSFSVFHYSGHTKQINGDKDRDGEALDEYLWPHDNRFISDAEVGAWLRATRGWVWADFAGCEAAGFDDGIASGRALVTASSQENEKSYESPHTQNSVWGYFLIDEAYLQRKGDLNGDGRITIQEAWVYATDRTPSYTQHAQKGPQHPYLAGGDGGEFFLQAPPPPPPPPPPPQGQQQLPISIPLPLPLP